MPSSHSCQTARSSLAATKALHVEFAAAYALATKTRERMDIERVRELRKSIDAAVLEFAEANKTLTVPKLVPNIFANWPSCLETIRVTELNKEFTKERVEIGGKTKEELIVLLERSGKGISDVPEFMLASPEFTALPESEQLDLICLQVSDLGFSNWPTTEQIFTRVIELGLELCPAEVGPQYRLVKQDMLTDSRTIIGMRPISDRDGQPGVFCVGRNSDGPWLDGDWAGSDRRWVPSEQFMFRLRKST